MDPVQYIRNKLKVYDSSIDTANGSPIGDLMLNPLSLVLEDGLNFEEHILNNLSLKDPENMEDDEIEAIISNFLVERSAGAKSSGYIRVFYRTPVSVALAASTTFRNPNTGYTYKLTSSFAITKEMMTVNNEYYPLYHTGNIAIEAVDTGAIYDTPANTITELVTSLRPEPASVRNLQAISAGVDGETNTALVTKTKNSVNNKSIASLDGIERNLLETFPTITALDIKSNGDSEMIRDLAYEGADVGDVCVSDYDNKISGLYAYPYNQSIAYVGRFEDTDETTMIALPDPEDFTYEFTNTMYEGLMKEDDATYANLGVYNILEENFNAETRTGYDDTWVLSDGQTGYNKLLNPDEITNSSQVLTLGVNEPENSATYDITSIKAKVLINVDDYNAVMSRLQKMIDQEAANQEDAADIKGGGR